MECPDCKIKMERLQTMSNGEYLHDDIYKCPKCKIEIEKEKDN